MTTSKFDPPVRADHVAGGDSPRSAPVHPAIVTVTLVVADYDDAIAWYCGTLGFALLDDTPLAGGKRWVRVAPRGAAAGGCALLLARAANAAQAERIGDQTGGRVGFFLHVADFDAEHARLCAAGVRFVEGPRDEAYGRVAVFADCYGNKWDLVGPGPLKPVP